MRDYCRYIGIPFVVGGRDIQGFDCWGFLKHYYKNELNIDVIDYDVTVDKSKEVIETIQKEKIKPFWKKIQTPVNNCVVLLGKITKAHHVGIYVDGGVLHCTNGVGVVYNRMSKIKLLYNRVEFYECCNKNP